MMMTMFWIMQTLRLKCKNASGTKGCRENMLAFTTCYLFLLRIILANLLARTHTHTRGQWCRVITDSLMSQSSIYVYMDDVQMYPEQHQNAISLDNQHNHSFIQNRKLAEDICVFVICGSLFSKACVSQRGPSWYWVNVLSSFQLTCEFSPSRPPDTNIAKIMCQGSSARDSILLQRELNQFHFHWLERIFPPFSRHVARKSQSLTKIKPNRSRCALGKSFPGNGHCSCMFRSLERTLADATAKLCC